MKRIKVLMPFLLLTGLLLLLTYELFYAKPRDLPSVLVGEALPTMQLQNIFMPEKIITEKNFVGQVALINVWATWCESCALEAPMLLKIKNEYHIPIYGIAYKDNIGDINRWLKKYGNPFVLLGNDQSGNVAIDLGVYGTPETFVINREGKILYRHIGVIDQPAWDQVLYPFLKKIDPFLT